MAWMASSDAVDTVGMTREKSSRKADKENAKQSKAMQSKAKQRTNNGEAARFVVMAIKY
jgi:hypothetical protein